VKRLRWGFLPLIYSEGSICHEEISKLPTASDQDYGSGGHDDVEKCAIGVFHHDLGQDLQIPFTPLQSSGTGWRDGLHFVEELIQWTVDYEKRVVYPTQTADQYVKAYVDSATKGIPTATKLLRGVVAMDLDDRMRESLW